MFLSKRNFFGNKYFRKNPGPLKTLLFWCARWFKCLACRAINHWGRQADLALPLSIDFHVVQYHWPSGPRKTLHNESDVLHDHWLSCLLKSLLMWLQYGKQHLHLVLIGCVYVHHKLPLFIRAEKGLYSSCIWHSWTRGGTQDDCSLYGKDYMQLLDH